MLILLAQVASLAVPAATPTCSTRHVFKQQQMPTGFHYAFGADLYQDGSKPPTVVVADVFNHRIQGAPHDQPEKSGSIAHIARSGPAYSRREIAAVPGASLERLALADMNRDGRSDVVVVDNSPGGLYVFEAGRDGGWASSPTVIFAHPDCEAGRTCRALSVMASDVDGDGWNDAIVSYFESAGPLSWFKNPRVQGKPWIRGTIDENVSRGGNIRGEVRTIVNIRSNELGDPAIAVATGTGGGGQLLQYAAEKAGGERCATPTGQVFLHERIGLAQWCLKSRNSFEGRPMYGTSMKLSDGDAKTAVVLTRGYTSQDGFITVYRWIGEKWTAEDVLGVESPFEAIAGDVLTGDGGASEVVVIAQRGGRTDEAAVILLSRESRSSALTWCQEKLADVTLANHAVVADFSGDGQPDIMLVSEQTDKGLTLLVRQ